MSIEQHIVTLEQLVAADAELKGLTDRHSTETGDLDGVRAEQAELQKRLSDDAASVEEMERTRKDLLNELRQSDKQIERSRDRLNRARNEREQNAAERELDELRKLQRDRDDEIKKVAGLAEQARDTIAENKARLGELDARLEGSLEGTTKLISSLEADIAEKKAARDAIAEKLPSLTRRRYQSIYDRGRTPVAKTHDGTCLGCYVKLPPMVFHQMLSRSRFEECSNCHRIIYYAPPPTEEEKAAEEAKAAEGDGAAAAAASESSS